MKGRRASRSPLLADVGPEEATGILELVVTSLGMEVGHLIKPRIVAVSKRTSIMNSPKYSQMNIYRYLSDMAKHVFPSRRRMQWKLFLLGLLKIPMIGYCRPRIVDWSPERVRVRIPLRRRTRNHFKSMYFGALMVGADLTAGLHAYAYSLEKGWKVSFAFKSSSAEFLRRPDTNVTFEMAQGREVEALLEKSNATGERHHMGVPIAAYDEEGTRVAEFVLELSVRVKK